MTNKDDFQRGLLVALKEQIHTDVQLNPRDNGCPIHAHKMILAARSKVFRDMLESDECKASENDTITFPDLNCEELECFLEFLYSSDLSTEKLEAHARSLFLAADKYEIPYLQEFCRSHFQANLNASNALDVLELSDIPSDITLRDAAIKFIVDHMEDIVVTATYESFVQRNPLLSVAITRAFLDRVKVYRPGSLGTVVTRGTSISVSLRF